jgi:dihydroneopterin aldolase
MDKIFIKNLRVIGILGVHPYEQRKPQRIRVNVEVTTDIAEAAKNDDVKQTIDYSMLSKHIMKYMDINRFFTIEALIEALAQEILKFDRVEAVKLSIEKPNAVPEAESVGVEISRQKQH